MRQCPFAGCKRKIRPDLFACSYHWKSLNKGQQARIYEAYDSWRLGKIKPGELRRRQQAVLDEVQGVQPTLFDEGGES